MRWRYSPFATHEYTNGRRFSPAELAKTGGEGTSQKLANEGDNAEKNDIAPDDAGVEETQIGLQPRESKVLWMAIRYCLNGNTLYSPEE
jgi:hypothetical protein